MTTAWQQVVALLDEELAATEDPRRQSPLRCRLALLHWDLFTDRTAAAACLSTANDDDEQVFELRRQILLEESDAAAATDLCVRRAQHLARTGSQRRAAALMREAALMALLWSFDGTRALLLAAQAEELDETHEVGELMELAQQLDGDAPGRAERALKAEVATMPLLLDGALALWDELDDADRAAQLIKRACELDESDVYVLTLADEIGAAAQPGEIDRHALSMRELELLSAQWSDSSEVAALAVRLSQHAIERGELERARAMLALAAPAQLLGAVAADNDEHTDPALMREAAWAKRLASRLGRDVAARGREPSVMARAYGELADGCPVSALRRAYRVRAAECLARAGAPVSEVLALLEQCRDESPADPHVAAALVRVCIADRDVRPLVNVFEAIAGVDSAQRPRLLRWAALIAEAHSLDAPMAVRLRRDGLAGVAKITPDADATGLGDLQRLYRREGETARLIDAYQRDADIETQPERAALLFGIIAAIRLKAEQLRDAEQSAAEALGHDERDPLAIAVKAAILRAEQRAEELAPLLVQACEVFQAPRCKATFLRELARLSQTPAEARRYLEQARLQASDDLGTLSDLAQHYEQTDGFAEAVKLRQKIAETTSDAQTAARAYIDVGLLHLHKLGNIDHAKQALQEALRRDPENERALDELSSIHRERGDQLSLLDTLQRRLALEKGPRARSDLQLEIAEALDLSDHEPHVVLEAYLAAVRLDLGSDDALIALSRAAAKHERWEMLAEALAALPERDLVLDIRAEALSNLGRVQEVEAVRQTLYDRATTPRDRADRAYDLGRAREQLTDIEGAIACYRLAVGESSEHRPSLRALQRIYQANSDMPSLQAVLEQELEVSQDPDRRCELLLELSTVHDGLGDRARSARVLEQVLELSPDNDVALERLEAIYVIERPLDLARLLQHRATIETDGSRRALLLLRGAEIFRDHAQDDDALAAYAEAARADRDNRDAFTAFEAFCYERELWREVMEMYEATITYVEEGHGRAYRLSDLYARRGQLQLRYLDQPGEAAASYLSALEHDPKSESAMRALQSIFLHQEDWLGLVRAYEHRAGLLPDNELFRLEALRQAARLATSRLPPDSDDALRLWGEIISADPNDIEAAENLERIYEAREMWPQLATVLETRLDALGPLHETIGERLRLAQLWEGQLDDPERAARAYEAVRAVEEHHETALRELARIYEATDRWEECIGALRDLVIIEADRDERSLLYFRCGSIMEARFADDRAAIEYYEKSLEESAGCLPAVHGLRDLYIRQERWQDVLDTLSHERRLWEGEAEQAGVLARMAEIRLKRLGDRRGAIEEFEDALAIDKSCQPALIALFDIAFDEGEDKRALELADRLAPQMAGEGAREERSQFFCRRGLLLTRAGGDYTRAAESLVYALEVWPNNLEALDGLIELFRVSPDSYDYGTTFRDLESIYRGEGDQRAISHVLVAAGALCELAGDAEQALEHYHSAEQHCPDELGPARARCELLVRLRRVDEAVDALRAYTERCEDKPARARALLALAELHADVRGEAQVAAQLCNEAVVLDPTLHEAGYLLAQQLYVLTQYDEARDTIDAVITQADAHGARAAQMARYYHYRGVTELATLGVADATASFRRALQLEPASTEAAMALARQMVLAGTREEAEELLAHTIHESERRGDTAGANELRRSLAAIHLGAGRHPQAIKLHQKVIAAGAATVEDHLALAEIHARSGGGGIGRAIDTLRAALDKDPLDPHVFVLLSDLYQRAGEGERAARVLSVMSTIGLAGHQDRVRISQLRRGSNGVPLGAFDDRARQLLALGGDNYVERMWRAVRPALERVFPLELEGRSLMSLSQVEQDGFRENIMRCVALCGIEAEIVLAKDVPGGVVADEERLTIDQVLVERDDREVAFAVARTLELLRSGHSLVSRLAVDDRLLLVELLGGLLAPADRRSDLAEEFMRRLPAKTLAAINDTAGAYQSKIESGAEPEHPSRWLDRVEQEANGLGLLACDDIAAALRMSATLGGQELALGPDGTVAVKAVSGGPEMVQLYLSDAYEEARKRLV
ncbi:MAG: hypothetical protein KC503_26480 [Myxococcales bacterium]|nr:hypothetical protein [Myxococcales bacterium]